jgi:hypothetical protein
MVRTGNPPLPAALGSPVRIEAGRRIEPFENDAVTFAQPALWAPSSALGLDCSSDVKFALSPKNIVGRGVGMDLDRLFTNSPSRFKLTHVNAL